MADDTFKDWQPGDPKYSAATIAGNFRAIRKTISDLLSTGGRDIIISMTQVGRALNFQTAAGRTLTGATMPLAPTNPKGAKIIGRYYAEGDVYVVAGSSYVTLVGHNATSDLAGDIANGRVTILAAAGLDAETSRGQYQPGLAYNARDVVYVGDPFSGSGPVSYYKAFIPTNVAPPNFPWGLVATYQRDVIRAFVPGVLGANRRLWAGVGTLPCFLPFGMVGSRFVLGTAPAADLTLSLRKNGNQFGTVTFSAGSTTGTLPSGQSVALGATDVLSVHAPASADSAAADLSIAFLTMPQT